MWPDEPPADRDRYEVERRELWYTLDCYLVRTEDHKRFIEWAEGVDFWGRWMPDSPEEYIMLLGEYAWSPAFQYFQRQHLRDHAEGWILPGHACPSELRNTTFRYLREAGTFDCSVDETYTLRLPSAQLVTGLGLRWSGNRADWLDAAGQLTAFDPTAHQDGPRALLLREDSLREFLKREKLTACWTVLGEKYVIQPGANPTKESLRLSGAYILGENGLTGFLKCMLDDRGTGDSGPSLSLVATIRTP